MDDIIGFVDEYRWLSNFWPVTIFYEGMEFPSVEHAYVFAKNPTKIDYNHLVSISPGSAKSLGKKVELADTFNKLEVMKQLISLKFKDPVLRQKLLNTGDVDIIEFNNWGDTFWGVTPSGRGLNHLGNIIKAERKAILDSITVVISTEVISLKNIRMSQEEKQRRYDHG